MTDTLAILDYILKFFVYLSSNSFFISILVFSVFSGIVYLFRYFLRGF